MVKARRMAKQRRMTRERKTVEAMLWLYCRERHSSDGEILCAECTELRDYAWLRLQKCPFQAGKTTCTKCPVHCYKPAMRARIRDVMRYAGPRMIYKHPLMAIGHLFDGLRQEPVRSGRKEVSIET